MYLESRKSEAISRIEAVAVAAKDEKKYVVCMQIVVIVVIGTCMKCKWHIAFP